MNLKRVSKPPTRRKHPAPAPISGGRYFFGTGDAGPIKKMGLLTLARQKTLFYN